VENVVKIEKKAILALFSLIYFVFGILIGKWEFTLLGGGLLQITLWAYVYLMRKEGYVRLN